MVVRRSHGFGRKVAGLLAALVLAGSASLSAPAPTRAAVPSLGLVTAATYEVLPDQGRIAVSLAITATNHLRDTVTRSFFFDRATLAVHGEAANLTITAAGTSPTIRVASRSGGQAILDIRFGTRLRSGKSMTLQVGFDLVDPGGAPDRPFRISPSLVLFRAWAFGTPETPGSSTTVILPADYAVRIGGGPLIGPAVVPADPTEPGSVARQSFASGTLETPLAFVADVAADRPGGYIEGQRSASLGDVTARVVFRSWPDDPAWRERVSDLVLGALPAFHAATGIPWRLGGPLVVTETLPSGDVRGAALDVATRELSVGYAADDATIVRALARAWFNGSLVGDRWIAEGFGDLAAESVAADLGVALVLPELTRELRDSLIALNDWGPPGSVTAEQEAYAAAAARAIARDIAARAGPEAMAGVWRAAAEGLEVYPEPGPAPGGTSGEPASIAAPATTGPPDWRTFLDLLEETSGQSFEDLWRQYVVRSSDTPALRERRAAQAAYATVLGAADGWRIGDDIRTALRTWRFDEAIAIADDTLAVLARRDEVKAAIAARGLESPASFRLAFEGPDGLRAAAAEAAAIMATLGVLDAAAASRPADPDLVVRLGLALEDPEADLTAARAAFVAGDLDAAITAADAARHTWTVAHDLGLERLLRLVIGLLALAALVAIGVVAVQRRRRGRVTSSSRAHAVRRDGGTDR